ncbi:hypothetical protein [Catenovulum sediminis]|uniref:Uncharacterized protein n=1 Tax=Catenovulum sediminis TaxID=1740262 RepID=A0ABV1RHW2_9ALTE
MNNTTQSADYQNKTSNDLKFQCIDIQDELNQNAKYVTSVLVLLAASADSDEINLDAIKTLLNLCIDKIDTISALSSQLFQSVKYRNF